MKTLAPHYYYFIPRKYFTYGAHGAWKSFRHKSSLSTVSSAGAGTAAEGGAPPPPPPPAPMQVNPLPPFLREIYNMVDDPTTDEVVSWSSTNNSFIIWDHRKFEDLAPTYFKHSNLGSFIRQLNTYGFRKVGYGRQEFAHEEFLRDQKHLLKNIVRRTKAGGHNRQPLPQQPQGQSSSLSSCVEVGKYGPEEEVERLKGDKNVLMQEIDKLSQQQQTNDDQLQAMTQRLQGTEKRQQLMTSFLVKAVFDPRFLAQFAQQQNESTRLRVEANKRRRLNQNGVASNHHSSVNSMDGQIAKHQAMNLASASPCLRTSKNSSNIFPINGVPSGGGSSSGGALREVLPPASCQTYLPALTSPLVDLQALPDISKLSRLQELVPDSSFDISINDYMHPATENDTFLGSNLVDEKLPLEVGGLSPDGEMDFDRNFLVEMGMYLAQNDPSCKQSLEQSPNVETSKDQESAPVKDQAAHL